MASRFFSKAMAAGSGLGGRLWPDMVGTRDSSPTAGVGAARLTGGWGPALCDRVRLRRRGLSATVMLQQWKDRGMALQRQVCSLARANVGQNTFCGHAPTKPGAPTIQQARSTYSPVYLLRMPHLCVGEVLRQAPHCPWIESDCWKPFATAPLKPQLTCACGCTRRTSSRPGPSSQPACAPPAGGTCRGTTPRAHPRRPRSGTPRRAACQAGSLAPCRLSISAGRPTGMVSGGDVVPRLQATTPFRGGALAPNRHAPSDARC